MSDTVLRQLSALERMPIDELKRKWRELCGSEPNPRNRDHIVSRLAYRIQELTYGGLKVETRRRIETLGALLESERASDRRKARPDRPMIGTRLVREYNGTEHVVTVTAAGFEWQGRPYQSLSAIARAISGTRWNGPLFFGLRRTRGAGR